MATSPITKPLQNLETKYIRIIGVPLDLGQSRRGVDMGPSAMRVAGLEAKLEALGYVVEDGGNVPVAMLETEAEGDPHAKYLEEITETCSAQADLVIKTLEAEETWLDLGGDHLIAAGSGVRRVPRVLSSSRNQRVGLLWIDAHSDINTPETSPSGNVHGMPLGAIMGLFKSSSSRICTGSSPTRCGPRNNCVLVGIRDVDEHERRTLTFAALACTVFTMRDIDERGMRSVMEEALRLAGRGTVGYHVSLDLDWIDPEDAPGVGTPVWGGATYREAPPGDGDHRRDHGRMLSFELVEVNPVLDERNQTAELAVELALSAFGKKIL